jgi:RNA polymerase sigma factor (sigma-70 family)
MAQIDKARVGDRAARQVLFDLYAPAVLRMVRHKMNSEMRSAWDSNDFLQEARLKLAQSDFENMHFANPDAFLGYLIWLTERIVQQAKRKLARRTEGNVNQVKPLDKLTAEELERVIDKSPEVCDVEIVEEQWRYALATLTPSNRLIALWLREGFTHVEIAQKLECSERTVRRVVVRLKELLLPDEDKS